MGNRPSAVGQTGAGLTYAGAVEEQRQMDHKFDDYLDADGNFCIPEERTLVDHVEKHTRNDANDLAYRYIDYSRERDGEVLELTWKEFGIRLRAVAGRLQQVTKPGDRVAVLAPQGLEYVVAFF